jgi:predicted ATPase
MIAVEEGLGMAARGERFYEAELWRLRGELLLRGEGQRSAPVSGVSPSGSPEASFLKAKEIAHRQGAMWLELRSAMSLIRLRRQTGDTEAARRTLVDLVAKLTEGFETTDLREARGLLEA